MILWGCVYYFTGGAVHNFCSRSGAYTRPWFSNYQNGLNRDQIIQQKFPFGCDSGESQLKRLRIAANFFCSGIVELGDVQFLLEEFVM